MARSKSKLSIADVCRTYYETQVFGPGGIGDLSQLGFFPAARINLEVRDVSFKGIDDITYTNEIMAANIELFGLAWLDHEHEFDTELPGNSSADEIVFTKRYLTDTGRGDIWQRMGAYTDALATSMADSIDSENWGRLRDYPTIIDDEGYKEFRDNNLIDRATVLAEQFGRHTDDGECVKRLMVRSLTIPCGMHTITAVSQNFSLVLAERVRRDPKPDGLFALQRIIVGLYENAVGYLEEIRDYGSYEAAKSARSRLIEQMIRHVTRKHTGDSNPDFC